MTIVPTADAHPSVFASDRRKCDRIDVALWTRIGLSDGSEYPARITNVSPGGLMTMTPCPAAMDVQVRVKLADIGWVDGKIAWTMGDRMGVEFDRLLDADKFTSLAPYCL
jgi:hypothetical protein